VNWARCISPAIKSLNEYYFDLKIGGGAPEDNIFAVAKYEQANASPAFKDVVLCFANLFEHSAAHSATISTFDLRGGDPLWSLLGLSTTRSYNVRNPASSGAGANLWGSACTGADIYSNGVFISLGGGTLNPITADGELAQFLKIVDVTPPPRQCAKHELLPDRQSRHLRLDQQRRPARQHHRLAHQHWHHTRRQ
jgi:hypothetical protein